MKKIQKKIALILLVGLTQSLCADTLYERAKEGKFNSVKHLIDEKKQNVNGITKGETPLFAAVKNYQQQEAAVEKGAQEGKEKELVDYNKTIIALLERGASMAQDDQKGRTVFHYAAGLEDSHLLELLLENMNTQSDRAFNIADLHGRTPLHIAAENANYEMVKLLCDAGAKADITTRVDVKKPIDVVGKSNKSASAITKTSIRKLLQETENNPITPKPIKRSIIIPAFSPKKNKSENESPSCSPSNTQASSTAIKSLNIQLVDAAIEGDLEKVKDLVAQGALVSAQEDKQLTPLLSALRFYETEKHHSEIIDFLILKGACISSKDRDNKTALHFAVDKEDLYLVKKIIEAITKIANHYELINARDSDGNTALHYAAQAVNVPIATLLLQNKASIAVQNNKKQIPLDVINEKGSRVYDRTEKILAQDIERIKKLLNTYGAVPSKESAAKTKHQSSASQQLPSSHASAAAATTAAPTVSEELTDWDNQARTGRARSHSIVVKPNGLKKD